METEFEREGSERGMFTPFWGLHLLGGGRRRTESTIRKRWAAGLFWNDLGTSKRKADGGKVVEKKNNR